MESGRTAWGRSAIVLGVLFVALALVVRFLPQLTILIDAPVAHVLTPLTSYGWVQLFLTITEIGSVTGIVTVALGTAYFLRREHALIARLTLALVGSTLVAQGMKLIIERVRPDPLVWITHLSTYSCPSGHATSSMVLYGFIALVSQRPLSTKKERLLGLLVPAFLILTIGLSRIILGEHFLTDVTGGYLLGAFWLSFVFWLPLDQWLSRYPQGGSPKAHATDSRSS